MQFLPGAGGEGQASHVENLTGTKMESEQPITIVETASSTDSKGVIAWIIIV